MKGANADNVYVLSRNHQNGDGRWTPTTKKKSLFEMMDSEEDEEV